MTKLIISAVNPLVIIIGYVYFIDSLLLALFAQLFEFLTLYLSNCLGMLIVYKQSVFLILH